MKILALIFVGFLKKLKNFDTKLLKIKTAINQKSYINLSSSLSSSLLSNFSDSD